VAELNFGILDGTAPVSLHGLGLPGAGLVRRAAKLLVTKAACSSGGRKAVNAAIDNMCAADGGGLGDVRRVSGEGFVEMVMRQDTAFRRAFAKGDTVAMTRVIAVTNALESVLVRALGPRHPAAMSATRAAESMRKQRGSVRTRCRVVCPPK